MLDLLSLLQISSGLTRPMNVQTDDPEPPVKALIFC